MKRLMSLLLAISLAAHPAFGSSMPNNCLSAHKPQAASINFASQAMALRPEAGTGRLHALVSRAVSGNRVIHNAAFVVTGSHGSAFVGELFGAGVILTAHLWSKSRAADARGDDAFFTRAGTVAVALTLPLLFFSLLKSLGWFDFISVYRHLQQTLWSYLVVSVVTGTLITFIGRLLGLWIQNHDYAKSQKTRWGILALSALWAVSFLTWAVIAIFNFSNSFHSHWAQVVVSTALVMLPSSVYEFVECFQMPLARHGRTEISPETLKTAWHSVWWGVMIRLGVVYFAQTLIQVVLQDPLLRILATYYSGILFHVFRTAITHGKKNKTQDPRWTIGAGVSGLVSAMVSGIAVAARFGAWEGGQIAVGALLYTILAVAVLKGYTGRWIRWHPDLGGPQRILISALRWFLRYPASRVLGLGKYAIIEVRYNAISA